MMIGMAVLFTLLALWKSQHASPAAAAAQVNATSAKALAEAGVADGVIGLDIVEPPFLFEMQRQGLHVLGVRRRELQDGGVIQASRAALALVGPQRSKGIEQSVLVHGVAPPEAENKNARRMLETSCRALPFSSDINCLRDFIMRFWAP